jgi:hypothetical protein
MSREHEQIMHENNPAKEKEKSTIGSKRFAAILKSCESAILRASQHGKRHRE